MEIKTVYAVYFSATGRTRKVVTTLANAIAQTLELPLETVDFTLPAAREETYAFTDKDLVIFGTPTYAGKVPNKLLPFVQTGFAGNGALAVPVVTFGNRSFDNSLAELWRESGERGLPHHRRRRVRLPARLFGYAGCGPSRPRGHDRARAARRGGRDEARQND